jgi:hypothetical protein
MDIAAKDRRHPTTINNGHRMIPLINPGISGIAFITELESRYWKISYVAEKHATTKTILTPK